MNPATHPLLSLQVSIDYPGKPDAVKDARFEIEPGEIVGLVGQSGSGKSSIALAVLNLLGCRGGKARGAVLFRGRNLLLSNEKEMRGVRGRQIGLVLQSPASALNPALRIGTQLAEAWKAHADGSRRERTSYLLDLMRSVSLPADESFLRRYPGELSVGQAQRVVVAMGVIHRPALLVADEPTSALDVIAHAEILQLFRQLNRDLEMGILYISHDLLSVASFCHRVAILHEGEIVEFGSTERIFASPANPYTRRLIDAIPWNTHGLAAHPGQLVTSPPARPGQPVAQLPLDSHLAPVVSTFSVRQRWRTNCPDQVTLNCVTARNRSRGENYDGE
jgi:ABC-type dipeptide/oligopeptide/nickel transport system ATPase component